MFLNLSNFEINLIARMWFLTSVDNLKVVLGSFDNWFVENLIIDLTKS